MKLNTTLQINFSLTRFLLATVTLFLITTPRLLEARVFTGLEVFLAKATYMVKGKRVGLITNPTGVSGRLYAAADLLSASREVNLVALFAPEHGIRGNVAAGKHFSGTRDKVTGLPVYSLYNGRSKQPSAASLAKVDVLIYSIQDVGSRAYTYIWHLAECMKAAARYNKQIIVLDVPNPLGAQVVDGPVTRKEYLSFIGLYPIPRVYGMTVGELARYLNVEEKINCNLKVVRMLNYRRGMSWEETGLPWVPTSPHIPSPQSAMTFAATGTLGETGQVSTGIGYTLPFQCVAAPWLDPVHMSRYLNALKLPGVKFRSIYYKPFYAAYRNQNIRGVQLHVMNPALFKPTTTEVAILCYLQKFYPKNFKWLPHKFKTFDKAMGTNRVRKMIRSGCSYRQIADSWDREISSFMAKRQKYLIYAPAK